MTPIALHGYAMVNMNREKEGGKVERDFHKTKRI